jgi:hypothetical protein
MVLGGRQNAIPGEGRLDDESAEAADLHPGRTEAYAFLQLFAIHLQGLMPPGVLGDSCTFPRSIL